MKQVSGQLRLDLAQYRDLAGFAQFGSDIDADTKKKITRGKVMIELLKQDQYQVQSVVDQVLTLFAGNQGYLDNLNPEQIHGRIIDWLSYLHHHHPDFITLLETDKLLSDTTTKSLQEIGNSFWLEGKND